MRSQWFRDKLAVIITAFIAVGIVSNKICELSRSGPDPNTTRMVVSDLKRIGFYDMNEADWLRFCEQDPNEIRLADATVAYLTLYGDRAVRDRAKRLPGTAKSDP